MSFKNEYSIATDTIVIEAYNPSAQTLTRWKEGMDTTVSGKEKSYRRNSDRNNGWQLLIRTK